MAGQELKLDDRKQAEEHCAREPIQFLGQIQPHGFLIGVSADWIIQRVSENLGAYIEAGKGDQLGRRLSDVLGPRASHDIRGCAQVLQGQTGSDRIYGVPCGSDGRLFDLAVHRSGEVLIVEGEPHLASDTTVAAEGQALVAQLRRCNTVEQMLVLAARQVRALSGFDRVMIYTFHPDGSGEVVAETKRADLQPFKGLRYPASDIPPQARALYLRNTIRIIGDVGAEDVDVVPRTDPEGRPLDLSMSVLRSVSPVHLQYLTNMGVAASMSISIVVEGELWGLIACHHSVPRHLSLQRRTALEVFGDTFSAVVEGRVRQQQREVRQEARLIHNRLMSQVSGSSVSSDDLIQNLEPAQAALRADGMASYVEGKLRLCGLTPSSEDVLEIMRMLNGVATSQVFSTNCLAEHLSSATTFRGSASGMLAIPVSRHPRDFVVFFRRELVRQVTWAGEPKKAVVRTADGLRLHPRQSFEAWRETVHGQSAHWTASELETAEALRVSLLEMMLMVTDRAEKKRKLTGDQQDLLIAELNHRVRNILNLIVGLVRQSSDNATSIDQFSSDVSRRVMALARAHDQLTSSGWSARSFKQMVGVEAGAYLGDKADRVLINGQDAGIEPAAFATVALVVHELITNAAKYGAFKDSHGQVTISLERDPEMGLSVEWTESGGAPVQAPTRRGFGSTIIERAIPHELGGSVVVDYLPEGLRVALRIPAVHVTSADGLSSKPATSEARHVMSGSIEGEVLLLEDNLLIALEAEEVLQKLGASDVQVASSNSAAAGYIRSSAPAFAVLDYNLGTEQSIPTAELLDARGVPFIFATGYGDSALIDERFRDRPVLTKPYSAADILSAYQKIMEPKAADDYVGV